MIRAVAEDLARGGVECDGDALAMSRPLGGLEDRLDRTLGRLEIGREASLVADAGGHAEFVDDRPETVKHFRTDPKRLRERLRSCRNHHELLEVEPVLRVRAAIDHVHERHRKRASRVASEPAVERLSGRGCGGPRSRERAAEDRVGPEPALRRRPVQVDQRLIHDALLGGVESDNRGGDDIVDVADGPQHALSEVHRGITVSQLDRLVLTRGCA